MKFTIFSQFFHNFHNSKIKISSRTLLKISHERSCLDRRRRITLQFIQMANFKKSFATEKTLALISEIFWNSEHFFILYCTVMSKIFILNLHMLVMHRPSLSKRYKLFCAISWYKRNLFAAFHPCAKRKCGNSNPQKNHNQ